MCRFVPLRHPDQSLPRYLLAVERFHPQSACCHRVTDHLHPVGLARFYRPVQWVHAGRNACGVVLAFARTTLPVCLIPGLLISRGWGTTVIRPSPCSVKFWVRLLMCVVLTATVSWRQKYTSYRCGVVPGLQQEHQSVIELAVS